MGKEWTYLKECLETGWVSSAGPFVERFEQEIASLLGRRYAVATVNGTTALHIALLVAGVKPNDEVLVPALTFIAPANAIRYVGAWPIFIDAEPDYWQLDVEKLLRFLDRDCRWHRGILSNRRTHRRVKAILPVHILGHPVDLDPCVEIARKYNLVVIEDAAESLGASYKGRLVGQQGDLACLSFNGNKIITAGGGGAVVTDDALWASKARYLTTQAKDDSVESIHREIGYNYRLTSLQAAVGMAQLEQLESHIVAKRRIAASYSEALGSVPGIRVPHEAPWAFSTFWMYTILVHESKVGVDSRTILRKLGEELIETRPLWQPLPLSPAYTGCLSSRCPVAEQLNRNGLSLPCSVGLTDADQQRVVESLLRACCPDR